MLPRPIAQVAPPKTQAQSQLSNPQIESQNSQANFNVQNQAGQMDNSVKGILDSMNAKYGIGMGSLGSNTVNPALSTATGGKLGYTAYKVPGSGTPAQPKSNSGGWEKTLTGFLPLAGGIAASAIVDPLLVTGDAATFGLGTVPAAAAAVGAFGAGSAVGRGLESWINQDILHITTPKSLGSNVGTALKTGAVNAPFGALGAIGEGAEAATTGAEDIASTAMDTSSKAATSWISKVASDGIGTTMAKGGAVGMTSGVINSIVNQQPPKEALPSILQDGAVTALTMGAIPTINKVVSSLLTDSNTMTVSDLTKEAETIIQEKNAAVGSILKTSDSIVSNGGTVDLMNSPNLGQDVSPEYATNLKNLIDQAKSTVFGPGTSDTLSKYRIMDPGGFSEEGLQNTYNNINRPNGVLTQLYDMKNDMASNVEVSAKDVQKALSKPLENLATRAEDLGGFKMDIGENGLTKTQSSQILRGLNGALPNGLSPRSITTLVNIIQDPASVGTISGSDLLTLQRELSDFGHANVNAISTVSGARQQYANDLARAIDNVIKSNVSDPEAYAGFSKDIVDLRNASDNIKPLVRQASYGKESVFSPTRFKDITTNYSNDALQNKAADITNKQTTALETAKFVEGVKEAASKGTNGIKNYVLKAIATPLGIATKLKNFIPSKIAELMGSSSADTIASGLSDSLGSQATSAEQSAVNESARLAKTPLLLRRIANSGLAKAALINSSINNINSSNNTNPILARLVPKR